MPRPRRVLGYARVSSEKQAFGSSLEDQQATLRAYAASRGVAVDRMYVEAVSGGRGSLEKRVQVAALLADVQVGDLVLVDKIDRWSRDPEFSYGSIRKLLEKGASFYAVSEALDPSTDEGDMMLGFRITFAREEHKRIRARMVGTRHLLRDRGFYSDGAPPFGYQRPEGATGADRHVLVAHPEHGPQLRDMFARCARGESLATIAAAHGCHVSRVRRSIRSRFSLGEILTATGWIKGRHVALVSSSVWTRANDALSGRRHTFHRPPRTGTRTDGWLVRDVARCGACGAKMAAAWAGPLEARRDYYACRSKCGAPYLRVDEVHDQAARAIEARLVELHDQLSTAGGRAATVDTSAARKKLAAKRGRYVEAFSDGAIDRDGLRKKLAALDAERTRLDALDAPVSRADRRRTLADLKELARAWSSAAAPHRRAICNELMLRIDLRKGETASITWRPLADLNRPEDE